MHRTIFTTALSLILLAFLFVTPGCDDVKGEIEEVFDQYISAKRGGDGDTVLKLIDPKNVEHYDYIVLTARSGSATQIVRMTPLERFHVGYIRASVKPEELKDLDGAKWVKLQCARRLEASGGDGPEFSLRDIKHRKPRASGELVVNGIATTLRMEFVKVEDQWLLNEECLDEWSNQQIREIRKLLGKSEDRMLLDMINSKAGTNVGVSIWGDRK